jgi:CRISPR-associated protein Cas1
MPVQNYQELPRIRDSISFLYFEYGKIEQSETGVEYSNKNGIIEIPVANLCALMLGPGTTITHRAVQSIVAAGCSIIWNGEQGVRYYGHATGETHKAYKLQQQAELVSNPVNRKLVALRMYQFRFKELFDAELSFEQLQGAEGLRVQDEYKSIASKYGLKWEGRNYNRQDWNDADDLNRALSTASSCINGICHSAIVAAGYSPGLGFIHQGKQLSFVYDIADLYKTKIAVPIAFATVAETTFNLETVVRKRCRQAFKNFRLLGRIIPDIDKMMSIGDEIPEAFDPDMDPTMPTKWWEPPPLEEEEKCL